jgi:hypothetical protein
MYSKIVFDYNNIVILFFYNVALNTLYCKQFI